MRQRRRKHLPGTASNPLHWFLLFLAAVDRLPPAAVALVLIVAAGALVVILGGLGLPKDVATLAGAFMLLSAAADWGLLRALPRAGRSFGPAIPAMLILYAMRWVVTFGVGELARLGLPSSLVLAATAALQLIGLALAFDAFWVEPQRLTVTRLQIRSHKLSPANRLRILHLGDLHVERLTPREEKVLEAAHSLAPDLILFSGDLLNISNHHDPVSQDGVLRFFERLPRPSLGIYAVSGSPAVDLPDVTAHLYSQMPHVRWLRDERISLSHGGDPFNVVGVECTHDPDLDAPRLAQLVERNPKKFTVLLYHSPDLAPDAAALGVDLQLSGHTHGGQIRLPFLGALVTGLIRGRKLQMGLVQLDSTHLYVVRGIGLEGKGAPRARFLCPPEIALIEVTGPQAPNAD